MKQAARHDAWSAGENYDAYMGRWSRLLAPRFLDWFAAPPDQDWLEVGCGTGALSETILARCNPHSIIAIDPSQGFVELARKRNPDARAVFQVGDAQALALSSAAVTSLCQDWF